MELPWELKCAIEKRTVGLKVGETKRIAQGLSEKYLKESGMGKKLLTREEEAVVYSVVRMPATFGAVSAALGFALDASGLEMKSLLDVGAGTGTASWAAAELIDLESVTCIEREDAMKNLGMEYMKEGPEVLQKATWVKADLTMGKINRNADLVISSYALNELSSENRIRVLDQLWEAANTMLLVIEPGTPVGFEELKLAREHLLGKGAHIAAPCPHEMECPLETDDWCHFTCRVARSKLHRLLKDGEAPFEDEKFTYMAFTKTETGHASSRILRHPFIEKGEITLEVCSKKGHETIGVKKKDGEKFKEAKKAKCGDCYYFA